MLNIGAFGSFVAFGALVLIGVCQGSGFGSGSDGTSSSIVFDPRLYLFGTFAAVPNGHVGVVDVNGDIQPEILYPGISFRGVRRYFGETIRYHNTMIEYDPYPYDVKEWIHAQSMEGTLWGFRLMGGNRVHAEHVVAVVRANGFNYDIQIGPQFKAAVIEVLVGLTDLEIRRTRSSELNELFREKVRHEINLHVTEGQKIDIVQITIEDKTVLDDRLARLWSDEIKEHARVAVEMAKRLAEEAEHLTAKARSDAMIARLNAEKQAENDRTLSTAESERDVQQVRNHQLVAAAEASAKSQTILADVELTINRAKVAQIEEFRFASEHLRLLKEAESRHNNAKEYWIGAPDISTTMSVMARKMFS
jgi:hypothetical protein